jgi:hypothetical protein
MTITPPAENSTQPSLAAPGKLDACQGSPLQEPVGLRGLAAGPMWAHVGPRSLPPRARGKCDAFYFGARPGPRRLN